MLSQDFLQHAQNAGCLCLIVADAEDLAVRAAGQILAPALMRHGRNRGQ